MVFGIVNGISLAVAPLILIPFVGYRAVTILGSVFFCMGTYLTRYAIDHSLTMVILSYGVLQSIGNMALIPTYVIPMRFKCFGTTPVVNDIMIASSVSVGSPIEEALSWAW